VVKADAYGLGVGPVGRALRDAGARSFFVALAEEGVRLREAVGPGPAIHILDGLMAGDEALCRGHGLIPCLNSPAQVARAVAAGDIGCAVQLDSGMNRLGLEPAEMAALAPDIARLRPSLVMSHLACADEPAHPMNAMQREIFVGLAEGLPGTRLSLAATGGVTLGEAFHFDLTRPGIGLYGGLPFAGARPVARLELPVIQVREVGVGESVGYGAAWTAARPSRIATLGAGYADGLIRAIGRAEGVRVFAGDAACPLVGRVSMDLVTADVTDLEEVPAMLEILGAHQGVDDLAAQAGTIGYEILTSLGPRYERVYLGAP
jgi:alanine racemase